MKYLGRFSDDYSSVVTSYASYDKLLEVAAE